VPPRPCPRLGLPCARRNQYGSNELVAELAATQDVFAPPALEALQHISKMVGVRGGGGYSRGPSGGAEKTLTVPCLAARQVPTLASSGQTEQLKLAVSTLRLLCRIFYSLNSPGLTPVGSPHQGGAAGMRCGRRGRPLCAA
jgi:hypothetical protein